MTTTTNHKTISKPLPACLSALALTAALLVTAGCNPKTPSPTTETPATSTTQSAAPGQSPVSIKPEANEAAEPAPTWTDQQILTCTVSQCWRLANKSEDEFFDIVQQLAAISAKNRDLALPDSEDAGKQAGEIIKSKAKADHDQLLFAVVDDAVRKVGKAAPAK
ncbi:MAG: hypothetical protein ABI380_07580 [Edaphobacter sp.]